GVEQPQGNVIGEAAPHQHEDAVAIQPGFHLLVLDGVYRREREGRLVFVPVSSPSTEEGFVRLTFAATRCVESTRI
ncbi:MAG TPA: hypothetical protein VJ993_02810, partial [Woeseiaceae bacterium]|nr:hypothetical protein [Woeseiaceae bacterium]